MAPPAGGRDAEAGGLPLTTVTTADLAALTRARLAGRARRVVPPGPLVPAAVLVPIVDRGGPHIVFAKRTNRVGHHKGQIAFPGGTIAAHDASPLAAALRECQEEVGLPPRAVEVLGVLDDWETYATHFVITPFVGLVHEPVEWRPDGEEIERVIEVPFAGLTTATAFRVEHWEREGGVRPVYFLEWNGDTIWGATARILKHYLDVIGEPE